MPLLRGGFQYPAKACPQTLRRICGDFQLCGNTLRSAEFQPDQRIAEPVGVIRDHFPRGHAPEPVGSHRGGGLDLKYGQPVHERAQAEDLLCGCGDLFAFLRRDALDAAELFRLLFDDLQGEFPEFRDDPLCQCPADPMDHAAGEIALNIHDSRGQRAHTAVRFKLLAEFRMAAEYAGQLDLLARLQQAELADNCNHGILGFEIQNDIAVVLIIIAHIIDGAFERQYHFLLHDAAVSFPNLQLYLL